METPIKKGSKFIVEHFYITPIPLGDHFSGFLIIILTVRLPSPGIIEMQQAISNKTGLPSDHCEIFRQILEFSDKVRQ